MNTKRRLCKYLTWFLWSMSIAGSATADMVTEIGAGEGVVDIN